MCFSRKFVHRCVSCKTTKPKCCQQHEENKHWIGPLCLKRRPKLGMEHIRYLENSLHLVIEEARELPCKQKYFADIYLDQCYHARTTSQWPDNEGNLYWHEEFTLINLKPVNTVSVIVFTELQLPKCRRHKRTANREIGRFNIPVKELALGNWNSLAPVVKTTLTPSSLPLFRSGHARFLPIYFCNNNDCTTVHPNSNRVQVRARGYYESIEVLPLSSYAHLEKLVMDKDDYKKMVNLFNGKDLKIKKTLSLIMTNIHEYHRTIPQFLADIVAMEVKPSQEQNTMFRGNSIASFAMEDYLRLTGIDYLHEVLDEFVKDMLKNEHSFEPDPLSSTPPLSDRQLQINQEHLHKHVTSLWEIIYTKKDKLPSEIRNLFIKMRSHLERKIGIESFIHLIGSCIILRFFVPSLKSPSMYGFRNANRLFYIPRLVRNFTLVTKCLQSLANDVVDGKEDYMKFMKSFIVKEKINMKHYLLAISSELPNEVVVPDPGNYHQTIDKRFELARLHAAIRNEIGPSDVQGIASRLSDAILFIDNELKKEDDDDDDDDDDQSNEEDNALNSTQYTSSSSLDSISNSESFQKLLFYSNCTMNKLSPAPYRPRPILQSSSASIPLTPMSTEICQYSDVNASVPVRRKFPLNLPSSNEFSDGSLVDLDDTFQGSLDFRSPRLVVQANRKILHKNCPIGNK